MGSGNAYVYLATDARQRRVRMNGCDFLIESDGVEATLTVLTLPPDTTFLVDQTPTPRRDRIAIAPMITFGFRTAGEKGPLMQARFYRPGESIRGR
jgi:hypothetical protein